MVKNKVKPESFVGRVVSYLSKAGNERTYLIKEVGSRVSDEWATFHVENADGDEVPRTLYFDRITVTG